MDFKLEDSLGFIVNRTNVKLKNELNQHFKTYDVTPEQWGLLNRLWEKEGISPKELSESLTKDFPNTIRIIDKLEKKEMIIKRENPLDKRSSLIYLTDKGKDLKNVLIPRARKALDKALKGIDKEKQQELIFLLNKIYENIACQEN